jgi:Flp pilus assembly protein TadG
VKRRSVPVRLGNQRGNTLIEFAVSFFLLFAFFSGMFQFAYGFYTYNTLVNAIRQGARYASTKPYDSTSTTPSATFSSAVQNMVLYGARTPAPGQPPVVAGLTANNVLVTVTGGGTGSLTAPAQMTVSIVNFQIYAVFTTFNLAGRPNATFPYTGILTPPSS